MEQKITLQSQKYKDIELLIELAKRLGINVTISIQDKKDSSLKQTEKLLLYLQQIADNDKLSGLIKSPEKWQKEIRKDRKQPYRA